MTLIAGFHSYGTPVLIGDFLLSTAGTPSGVRKKILRIADNFVLGWTGALVAAQSVITSLELHLDIDKVTLNSVKTVLTNSATSNLGLGLEVMLVCWVIDQNGHHCFLWNSLYPSELFLGDPQFAGSGESFVAAYVGAEGLKEFAPSGSAPPDPTSGALSVVTELMKAELVGPSTRPMGFGFAYEILQLKEGSRFEYVDDILYLSLTCTLDQSGQYQAARITGPVYKYEADGNLATVFIYDPASRKIDVHAVTPPGGTVPEQITSRLTQRYCDPQFSFPFQSRYYYFVLQFEILGASDQNMACVLSTSGKEDSCCAINASHKNTIEITISREMCEQVYRTIKKDSNR